MHGGMAVAKNFRRQGIPATVKGRANPHYPGAREINLDEEREERNSLGDVRGPTRERIAKAGKHVGIGDDKRGTRVYHFHDNPLDRMYSRLTRQARSASDEAGLRREYLALTKYRHHWHAAGLQASIGSADLNRVFASDPGSMSGMAKTEHQAHHRKQYRAAVEHIGWKPHIVVDNIVCAGTSIEQAGWSIGYNSRTQARDMAEHSLRESARKLANLWGIS